MFGIGIMELLLLAAFPTLLVIIGFIAYVFVRGSKK
ncbi:hypothetical protein MFFC18_30060 [Mariniblastus fucicola]|uniref:Uncharacterized protein n=1 Tax=Mariniblastus fucicola TaxID=980251 RepID=A0A5B9PKC0_9BACT|nr:hypothetical protein MFFC18_30060 [Mariniblastus fucicola]